jgi:tetratricopeptide (TPR) repeat protein
MKRTNLKTILFCVFLLFSLAAYTQNNTIDSLQKILQTQKEDTNKVNTLNELSKILIQKRNYDNALQYANNAISLARKTNFKKGEGMGYSLLGISYLYQGNYQDALKNSLIALRILKESELNLEIVCLSMGYTSICIGTIYKRQNNFKEASQYFLEGLKAMKKSGDNTGIA